MVDGTSQYFLSRVLVFVAMMSPPIGTGVLQALKLPCRA